MAVNSPNSKIKKFQQEQARRKAHAEAQDSAALLVMEFAETLDQEVPLEPLHEFLTNRILAGDSALGAKRAGEKPEAIADDGIVLQSLETLQIAMSEAVSRINEVVSKTDILIKREDAAAATTKVGRLLLKRENSLSRRLLRIENILLAATSVAAGEVLDQTAISDEGDNLVSVSQLLNKLKFEPLESLLDDDLSEDDLDQEDDEPHVDAPKAPAEPITLAAARVSSFQDYAPQENLFGDRSTPRRRPQRKKRDYEHIPADQRAVKHIWDIVEDLVDFSPEPLSIDIIRHEVVLREIDLSLHDDRYINTCLENNFLRFGNDGWWPVSRPIPCPLELSPEQVWLPRNRGERELGAMRLADYNKRCISAGSPTCRPRFRKSRSLGNGTLEGAPAAPVPLIDGQQKDVDEQPPATPNQSLPEKPAEVRPPPSAIGFAKTDKTKKP